MKWLVLLVFLSWPAGLCSATSVCWLFGAPESACVDIEPDAWSGPQDTPSPYSIQLTYDKDSHNFNVRVAGDEFRSVLLQARRPGSTEPVGTFLPPSQVRPACSYNTGHALVKSLIRSERNGHPRAYLGRADKLSAFKVF
ncbi:uncharacterized protein LOC118415620 [Branchiostoma floridae]|uniref:Uncharacterized protein LOC118415620 n=1 Tax=Branchiostoma floridae TaxID=7739 RepID=A0A9J7MR60_BRAFL|nr:uncharacterized protein LOC118415620 [Branchiostoma floridae]